MKPTQETYTALQTAYEHFNNELFGGVLPECLITLQRKEKRVYGYFWSQRFEAISGGEKTDSTILKLSFLNQLKSAITLKEKHKAI